MLLKTYTSIDKPKLLDRMSIVMRSAHYSKSTEEDCLSWLKKYNLALHRLKLKTTKASSYHLSAKTIMIYTQGLNKEIGVRSPLD